MKKLTKVRVELHKGNYHLGEFLGFDELGSCLIGITYTTINGISKNPNKKYISIFRSSEKKLEVL